MYENFALTEWLWLNTGKKTLESLLVDDVILSSRSAAFQVGPQALAEVKTIVVENARVSGSKRGISVQLHDPGDMHDIWCVHTLPPLNGCEACSGAAPPHILVQK